MSAAQHVTQNKVLINHMWEEAEGVYDNNFEQMAVTILTVGELEDGNKIRGVLSIVDIGEAMVREAAASSFFSYLLLFLFLPHPLSFLTSYFFFSYQNREWWRGEASSAAKKKRRTSINFDQPTNHSLHTAPRQPPYIGFELQKILIKVLFLLF